MSENARVANTRDAVGAWLANQALRIASKRYRDFVAGAVEYGMRAAARDHNEGRPAPGPWKREAGK